MICPRCKGVFPEGDLICPVDGNPLVSDSVVGDDWGGDTLSQEVAPVGSREASAPIIQRPARDSSAPSTAGRVNGGAAASAVQRGLTLGGPGPAIPSLPPVGDAELAPGTMAGEYQITGLIGTGGMGSVYAGVQPVIGKKVAIKVLLRELAANPQVLFRFMQEARAVNQAQSRYIVDIFSFGELPDGRHYFVMEQLEGQSLRDFLRARQTLGFDEAYAILSCVCKGLIAAHGKGIVHRDIKPENIMVKVEEDGAVTAKILDFGIAKLTAADSSNPGFSTRTGAAMGTPYYMSPEQCRGISVDHRTDIYALGIIIFEMFTGSLPFTARSYIDLVNKHLFASPPLPSQLKDTVSKPLESLILRCIAKDPSERPQTVEQLLDELSQLVPSLRGTRYSLSPTQAPEDPAAIVVPPGIATAAGAASARPAVRPLRPVVIGAVALLLAGGGAAAYLGFQKRGSAAPPAAVSAATLRVSSQPAGATVLVDGVAQRERTPLVVSTAPGRRKLRVELEGHTPFEEIQTLNAGKELELHVKLRPEKPVSTRARLIVITGNAASRYYLDDREVGRGERIELGDLAPGSHRIRVVTPGHLEREEAVTLLDGETTRLSFVPQASAGGKTKVRPKLTPKSRDPGQKPTSEDPDETLNPFKKK